MRLRTRRGVALLLGALAALLVVVVALGQQGVLERKDPSPTREQVLDDLPYLRDAIASGENVTIFEGPTPDPNATPVTYGDFRISPASFVGTPERRISATPPADPGPVTSDQETASTSPLFATPAYVPSGFQLVAVRSADGMLPVNVGIELVYEEQRTGDKFTIQRSLVFELPIDFSYDERSPMLAMKPTTFEDGRSALIYDWRSVDEQISHGIPPDAVVPPEFGYRQVLVFDPGFGTLTGVFSDGAPSVTIDMLQAIAESIK